MHYRFWGLLDSCLAASVQGFCYCDLLLAQGEIAVVLVRAAYDLDCWENRFNNGSSLDLSLPKLSLARAHVHIAVQVRADNTQQKESGDTVTDHTQKAQKFLEQAVAGLRAAGYEYYLPLALLARAAWFRFCEDFKAAHKDLDEVLEIAESGKMRLHLCDYHLESARLVLAEQDPATAKDHCDKAEQLIKETVYNRRLPELQALQQALS
jgi:hypothetical protein